MEKDHLALEPVLATLFGEVYSDFPNNLADRKISLHFYGLHQKGGWEAAPDIC